ncbi:MAG: hypothetical protein NT091_05245 [Candidatus Falkowbacteria bacterium]|nr:hypothetical protein [Candidatus Falkowbacteria bacterium]
MNGYSQFHSYVYSRAGPTRRVSAKNFFNGVRSRKALRAKPQSFRLSSLNIPTRKMRVNHYFLEVQEECKRKQQEYIDSLIAQYYFLILFVKKFSTAIMVCSLTSLAIYISLHFSLALIIASEDVRARDCNQVYYSKACRNIKNTTPPKNTRLYIDLPKKELSY